MSSPNIAYCSKQKSLEDRGFSQQLSALHIRLTLLPAYPLQLILGGTPVEAASLTGSLTGTEVGLTVCCSLYGFGVGNGDGLSVGSGALSVGLSVGRSVGGSVGGALLELAAFAGIQ